MEIDRSKLATYDELVQEVNTAIVETSSGRLYEIRAVMPGDILRAAGSPLMKVMTAKGLDISSKKKAEESIRNMPSDEQANILGDPEFIKMAQDLVCDAVLNVNLVNKPQEECDKELKEVSIDKLQMVELIELFTMTMTLATGDDVIKDFYSFREDGEEEQDESGEAPSDGEELREETDGTLVQEGQQESAPTAGTG